MLDKIQLIKQEIEKRIEQCYRVLAQDLLERERCETSCCLQQYKELLQFIDSLPEELASKDLEEAAENYGIRQGAELKPFAIKFFKAGAKWKKQQMKEALQTEYEKGKFDMREEMMKTLVEGEIVKDVHNQLSVKSEPLNDTFGKFGDKVKIIVIKQD